MALDIPATQKEVTSHVPATQKEVASDVPATQREDAPDIPATQREVAPDIPATQREDAPDIPATQREVAPDIPATQREDAPDIPATQREVAPDIPATQREDAPDIPATQREVAPDIPATQTEVAPDIPATQKEVASDVPATQKEVVTQVINVEIASEYVSDTCDSSDEAQLSPIFPSEAFPNVFHECRNDQEGSLLQKYENMKRKYYHIQEKYDEMVKKHTLCDKDTSDDDAMQSEATTEDSDIDTCDDDLTESAAVNQEPCDKKRKYDKLLACLFCGKTLKHRISEHLQSQHMDKPQVAHAFAATGKRRKQALAILRNKGNFKYNVQAIESKSDNIIVARRPNSSTVKAASYLPCTYCFAFYNKVELWRHVSGCTFNCKKGNGRFQVQANSRLLLKSAMLPDHITANEGDCLLESLSTKMDEIGNEIRGDNLIIRFGTVLLEKLGPRRKHGISQRMRQLARLKIKVNELCKNKFEQLYDCLSAKHFDLIVQAVKELVVTIQNEEDVHIVEKPGLALRLGHNLVKVSQIKYGMAMRNEDAIGEKEAERFSKLMSNEWCDRIASIALSTLKTNKFNKPELLPITSDLVKLKEYLSTQMSILSEKLSANPTYQTWRSLAEKTLARIVLLNKRRGTEASRMLISSYTERPNWKAAANEEILQSLSELERKMFQRIDMVQSQGKQNKKVATLMNAEMMTAIDVLIKHQTQCGIKANNKFLFANQEEGHLETWPILQAVAKECNCKHPNWITSNSLRKYISTVCQVMDLSDGEIKWLSNHLAHSVKTHDQFYKLQEGTVEITKVAKLLIATENGILSQFSGKTLEDINIEEIDMSETLQNTATTDDTMDEQLSTEDITGNVQAPKHYKKRWTREEKKIFTDHFAKYISTNTMPPNAVLQAGHKKLLTRSIPQLRSRVHNLIKHKLINN